MKDTCSKFLVWFDGIVPVTVPALVHSSRWHSLVPRVAFKFRIQVHMFTRWKADCLWCLCLSSKLPQFQDSPLQWTMTVSFITLFSSYTIRNFEARVPSQLNVRLSLYLQSITFKSRVTMFVTCSSELIYFALRKVIPRILLASSSKNLTFFLQKPIKVKTRQGCDWKFPWNKITLAHNRKKRKTC
jgi:hypothetical protein